jgi:hypothetical protein
VRAALVGVCRAWRYDLRLEEGACVGYGDGHGEGFAREVGGLRGCDHDAESGVVKRVFGQRTSDDLKAETDDSEEDKWYCNLEEIHRGETGMAAAGRRRRQRRHRLQTTT